MIKYEKISHSDNHDSDLPYCFDSVRVNNPDGLEKVVKTYDAKEHQSIWNGIMADYSFFSIGNQYVSTLLAGIFGVMTVLVAGLVFSEVMTSNHRRSKNSAHRP